MVLFIFVANTDSVTIFFLCFGLILVFWKSFFGKNELTSLHLNRIFPISLPKERKLIVFTIFKKKKKYGP